MDKRIRYLAVVAAIAVATTVNSRSGTISIYYGSLQNAPFDSADGSVLPIGDLLEVGYFAGGYNGGYSLSNFVSLGSGNIGDSQPSYVHLPPGFALDLTITQDVNAAGESIVGQQLAMVVFNNSTGINPTQEGIFMLSKNSTSPYASNWQVPSSAVYPYQSDIDADQLTAFPSGKVSNYPLAAGIFGFFKGTTTANNGGVELGVIPTPEPSSIALVITGLFGLVGLSRRRRS